MFKMFRIRIILFNSEREGLPSRDFSEERKYQVCTLPGGHPCPLNWAGGEKSLSWAALENQKQCLGVENPHSCLGAFEASSKEQGDVKEVINICILNSSYRLEQMGSETIKIAWIVCR